MKKKKLFICVLISILSYPLAILVHVLFYNVPYLSLNVHGLIVVCYVIIINFISLMIFLYPSKKD